jgi:hypothetical protein
MSGPFFGPSAPSASIPRPFREWEKDRLPDGWGQGAPVNVGQQGRKKDRAKMARMAQDADDDTEDWFGSARNAKNRRPLAGTTGNRGQGGKNPGGKTMSFDFSASRPQPASSPVWHQNQPHPTPSLLQRITSSANPGPQRGTPMRFKDSPAHLNYGAPKSTRITSGQSHASNADNSGRRKRENGRDRRELEGAGPRYKGGYGR